MTKKWKKEALHLWLTTNLSKSDIARSLGKPRTTVRDYLFRAEKEDYVLCEYWMELFLSRQVSGPCVDHFFRSLYDTSVK